MIETFVTSLVFAAIFFVGGVLRLPEFSQRHHRALLSFSAGVAVSYVFIHVLPELEHYGAVFMASRESSGSSSTLERYFIHLSGMLGFTVFYGLEHMVSWSKRGRQAKRYAESEEAGGCAIYRVHLFGFGAYGWLVTYIMAQGIREEEAGPILAYAIAMSLHFLAVDHSLRREHGEPYRRVGKNLLAAACFLGWLTGVMAAVPTWAVVGLLGFISGAVIMNSMIMELPKEREGKFLPFCVGAVFFAGLLLVAVGE